MLLNPLFFLKAVNVVFPKKIKNKYLIYFVSINQKRKGHVWGKKEGK